MSWNWKEQLAQNEIVNVPTVDMRSKIVYMGVLNPNQTHHLNTYIAGKTDNVMIIQCVALNVITTL